MTWVEANTHSVEELFNRHPLRLVKPSGDVLAFELPLPFRERRFVSYHDLMFDTFYANETVSNMALPMMIGRMANGHSVIRNLAALPHLIIGGATGHGKSMFTHSLICSLIQEKSPQAVRFVLMDPMRVEFGLYDGSPHLFSPISYDTKEGIETLRKIETELDNRLNMFTETGCRNISTFNAKRDVTLPYLVVVIDELYNFMSDAWERFLAAVSRIAALGRAAGIHLIMGTSRPDSKVLPGALKVNVPGRLAFKVRYRAYSEAILDSEGADLLGGFGDALFRDANGDLIRLQMPLIRDEAAHRIVSEAKRRYSPTA